MFKRTNKILAAGAIALSMAATPVMSMISAVPVIAAENDADITTDYNVINKTDHEYKAYQIFKGKLASDGSLVVTGWGDNVDGPGLLAAMKDDDTLKAAENALANDAKPSPLLANCKTAADAANWLTKATSSNSNALYQFAKLAESKKTGNGASIAAKSSNNTEPDTATKLKAGYYLFVDQTTITSGTDDVKNLQVLQAAGTDTNVMTITAKNPLPKVDKKVEDNETTKDDASNVTPLYNEETGSKYGESADHAIGEEFNFKIEAKIPVTAGWKGYETYYVQLQDTMSNGVTFKEITSVKVDGTSVTRITDQDATPESKVGKYSLEEVKTGEKVSGLKITFEDLKQVSGVSAKSSGDIKIEVIYKAYLNENATVSNKDITKGSTNNNSVKLVYSNDPTWDGTGNRPTGETPTDYVFVFTYELDNLKQGRSASGLENLPGATFSVSKGGQDISFVEIKDVNNNVTGYKKAVTGGSTTITSLEDGTFNLYGLDEGTYTISEINPPAGYNKIDPFDITIEAVHKENADANGLDKADLTLTYTKGSDTFNATSATYQNIVINQKGAQMPETGGMGTTMIYTAGMVLIGGSVYLASRKKKEN